MSKNKPEYFITDKFDIPIDSILKIPNARFIGNHQLDIDGCQSIKKYDTDLIVIKCKEHILRIEGDSLSMLTFSQGRVTIRGNINLYQIEEIRKVK